MNRILSTAFAGRSPRLRPARALLTLAIVLCAILGFLAAPAGAKIIHSYEGSFDGSDTPSGGFGYLLAAAVDNSGGPSAGDVYIGGLSFSNSSGYVYKFDEEGHYTGEELKGSETPQGSFNYLSFSTFEGSRGLAVDNSSGANKGDVYVADGEHHVVDRFNEEGEFLCEITGREYSSLSSAEQEHECAGATGSKTPEGEFVPGGFFSAMGVAVNPVNGDVYVSSGGTVVDEFNEAGEYIGQISDSHLSTASSLALNSSGELYVVNGNLTEGANLVKFDASGAFAKTVDTNRPVSVAVDTVTDHVDDFREVGREVAEYDAADAYFTSFGGDQRAESATVAVDSNSGRAYFGSLNGSPIYEYGPPRVVPDLTTGPATNNGEHSASLTGEVAPDLINGGGNVTGCFFEYGPTTAYGSTAPCNPAAPYGAPQQVSAEINGLSPATEYYFRLVAEDSEGASEGADESFTTKGPPSIEREGAEALTTSAHLRAVVNPNGYDTTCQVQYVSDATFQTSEWSNATTVPCSSEDLGAGFEPVVAKVTITGLARAATYHYRFLDSNQGGQSYHPADTFETYGIKNFSVQFVNRSSLTLNGNGDHLWKPDELESPPQAGAHPYELATTVTFSDTTLFSSCVFANCKNPGKEEVEYHNFTGLNTKDVHVKLPPGLIGNPSALPKCNPYLVIQEECPSDTQVGVVEIMTDYPTNSSGDFTQPSPEERDENGECGYCEPLYNLTPSGPYPAEFGTMVYGNTPAWIRFHIRTGEDYGVTADSIDIDNVAVPLRVRVRVWGVPANSGHAEELVCPSGQTSCPNGEPEVPLLTNPTSCSGPQTATALADTWQEPGQFVSRSTEIEGVTGCNAVEFNPSLEAIPTTNVADSPSGLHVDLHVPQNLNTEGHEDPNGLATADLKDAKVVLPKGLVVNPSSANGLGACTPSQIELHGPNPPTCPDAAKIGRVEVDTPLVDHPLPGAVYVASPHDNPFDSLLAIYVAVNDPETGVIVKLAGDIEADPNTGQLTTTFDDNPQLPFEDFKLDFFGGPRAALRTPPSCGEYKGGWTLTPWSAPESGPPAEGVSPFRIEQAPAAAGGSCPASAAQQPSAPRFETGTETPTAGKYSPFILHLHREDGSQELTSIDTTLPEGLVGKLAGVAECPDAAVDAARAKSGTEEQASPSCPASSEVGTVDVASGAGPAPYWVQGHAYLAGPYKGAPLSLAIVTPAVAGPYDLGDVVVRAALYVNPETTQITVKSDRIPTMLQGIPLDVRTINVKMDRPQFTLNPTSCEKMAVTGDATSVFGTSTSLSNPFQVGGCKSLAFKPHLAIALKGKTNHRGHPALTATLTMPPGNANVASAQVTLPHSAFLEQSHIRGTCLRPQLASHSCPASSVYGHARAVSPLLDQPLEGPVYLVTGFGYKLPALVADLNGQIEVQLHGKVDSGREDGIRNTFELVPDAPVSKFTLSMFGGRRGLIVNSENLCGPKARRAALAHFVGQNGLVSESEPKVKVRCGKHGHGKHRHGKHH